MKYLWTITWALALVLLLAIAGAAQDKSGVASDGNRQTDSVEGMVVPDSVYDRQPFSFAVPQIAGEVVTIQTVEGEVVKTTSADRYGRIFLTAGLPAGAYLVSGGSYNRLPGKIEVQQRGSDLLQRAPQSLQLNNPPQALKLSNQFSLNGHGFSPNCADMKVGLNDAGQTESPIVLAATKDQLKLAPVQQLQPGAAQMRVTNQATGESTEAYNVLIYDLHAELRRQNIHSHGDQTQLVVTAIPDDQPLKVKVNVASGPVDFGHGRKEAEAITNDGQAIFPVHAERGSGPFRLTWELASIPEGFSPVAYHPGSTGNDGNGFPGFPGTTSGDKDQGSFADDSGRKTKDRKDDTQSPNVPLHTKHCEWRFLRVEKTIYTQDNKELAEAKEKLGKALLDLVGKAAPTAGKVTKAALSALSISRANNVYLVYILVEIVDGAETVIDTRVVGPLAEQAEYFWSDSKQDDWQRENTIMRNRPQGGCPK